MKGPRITVTCECGQQTRAHYATRFECEGCDRTYDTSRIPSGDYERLASVVRRFRYMGWAFGLVLALLALWLITQGQIFVTLIGMMSILFVWWSYGRPFVRGRYHKALSSLPRWDLKAEPREGARDEAHPRRARSPSAPAAEGASGRGAVMLVTLEAGFDAEAERLAVSSALEGGLPLRLVDLVDMSMSPCASIFGCRSLSTPDEKNAMRRTASTAAALGLDVAILRVRSPRPPKALREIVAEERASLVIVGPSRVRDRKRLRRVVRQATSLTCLVWIADGLPL